MTSKPREYLGNAPEAPFVHVGDFILSGIEWGVYLKYDPYWSGVKVCARGAVPHKANYWLSWNGKRFSRTPEAAKADEHRPYLLDFVGALLLEYRQAQQVDPLDYL